jgi:hypothetical protein
MSRPYAKCEHTEENSRELVLSAAAKRPTLTVTYDTPRTVARCGVDHRAYDAGVVVGLCLMIGLVVLLNAVF